MRRVLIVDDEMLIRWALTEALVGRGCVVVEAEDARSARRAVDEGKPPFDVVLLDYRLPDCHDLTLLRAIKRSSPTTRILMMTAQIDTDVLADALSAGAALVLDKPLDLDAVCTLVLES